MKEISKLAATIAATMLLPFGAAQAAVATNTFTVSATIANFCTVSAANVGFGSVNAGAAATNTASSVTLTCNKGATVTSVALNNGANPSGTQKRMISAGGEFLNYLIDRPTGATFNTCPAAGAGPEWNAANTIVATSLFTVTGGAKLINICASIPAGQFPSAGLYQDTVTVTATYN
jgi:spore coat protein U-like protein